MNPRATNSDHDVAKELFLEQAAAFFDDLRAAAELLWNGYELIEQRLNRLDSVVWPEYRHEERTDDEREAVRKLRGYLSYHAERLNYRKRLAEGRSIGSGQVEGACQSVCLPGPHRQTPETNRSKMAHQKSQQYGNPLRRALRKPMENVLELRKGMYIIFYYTPIFGRRLSPTCCK